MARARLAYLPLLLAIALGGCRQKPAPAPQPTGRTVLRTEGVQLTAADGWTIFGDFAGSSAAQRAVVLLHQRNGSAGDWQAIERDLVEAGIAVLAIDQRGAGRSTGPRNGQDAPWVTTPDIAAADAWLQAKGFAPARIGFVGASYGANNALVYAAMRNPPPAVVLLSPGRSYHGVMVEPAARAFRGAALVLSASGDVITEGGPELIGKTLGGRAQVVLFDGDAHGTALLADKEQARSALLRFLKARL